MAMGADRGILVETDEDVQPLAVAKLLKALVEKPEVDPVPKRWKKGGYLGKLPVDPWGNGFVYLSPGLKGPYDLISYGADGTLGGEDGAADIVSWELEGQ